MNTQTNIIYASQEIALQKGEKPENLTAIPDNLTRAAQRKLEKKDSAQVSFNSGGLLSRFAAKIRNRKEQKLDQSSL